MELLNDHLHTCNSNTAQQSWAWFQLPVQNTSVQVILPKKPSIFHFPCAQRNSEVISWAPDGLSLVKRMVKSYQPKRQMQEEAEFHWIPFQRGFVWTQQPQGEEAGAQICLVWHKLSDTVWMLGQIKPSSRFSNMNGRALPSGPGVIAFCWNLSDYPDI